MKMKKFTSTELKQIITQSLSLGAHEIPKELLKEKNWKRTTKCKLGNYTNSEIIDSLHTNILLSDQFAIDRESEFNTISLNEHANYICRVFTCNNNDFVIITNEQDAEIIGCRFIKRNAVQHINTFDGFTEDSLKQFSITVYNDYMEGQCDKFIYDVMNWDVLAFAVPTPQFCKDSSYYYCNKQVFGKPCDCYFCEQDPYKKMFEFLDETFCDYCEYNEELCEQYANTFDSCLIYHTCCPDATLDVFVVTDPLGKVILGYGTHQD